MASKKSPPRKLKAGRRTVRTQGMSQSAFAGYGTQQQPPPPAPTETKSELNRESEENNEDKESNKPADQKADDGREKQTKK